MIYLMNLKCQKHKLVKIHNKLVKIHNKLYKVYYIYITYRSTKI